MSKLVDKVEKLFKNIELNDDDLIRVNQIIDKLIEKKNKLLNNKIITKLKNDYPQYKKYTDTIDDIKIIKKNNYYGYHDQFEIYITIYIDNIEITKNYHGFKKYKYAEDGYDDFENIYKIILDNELIFEINYNYKGFFNKNSIKTIDEDELIKSIIDKKKIREISQLYKNKKINFIKNMILLLDDIFLFV